MRCIVTAREEEKKGCKREERQVKQKVVNYKEVSLRGDDNNVMSLWWLSIPNFVLGSSVSRLQQL